MMLPRGKYLGLIKWVVSFPDCLSPDARNMNSRDSGGRESGEFYHVKDVMGIENVIEHGHNQLHSIFFPRICTLTELNVCAGSKAAAT